MIRILGTRGEIKESHPNHKKQSGILIDKVLFDAGESQYIKLKPEAIFITHLHPDHSKGLEATSKIPVYSLERPKLEAVTWHKLYPVREYGLRGEMTILPIPTTHSKKVKSCAFLILRKKKKILYTGDMIWINKKYHDYIKNCDLVITDGSFIKKGGMIRKDKKTGEVYGHQGIPNLVNLFKRLGAKQIVFVHFGNWLIKNPRKGYEKIKELGNEIKVWAAKDGEKISLEKLQITTKILPKEAQIVIAKVKQIFCPIDSSHGPFKSDKELKRHLKEVHPKEAKRWFKLLQLSAPKRGLYLVSPHGSMIADKSKTLIIKKRKFKVDPEEPLYLLEKDIAYGIIYLEEPQEIGKEKFKKLAKKHLISEKERIKWWKDTWPLYSYAFKFKPFKEPKAVKIPQGVQIFVDSKNIEFLSKEELISDWKTYDPMKLLRTKGQRAILLDDHRICHTWWNRLKKGKAMKSKQFKDHSLEEQKKIVRSLHEKIVEAFKKLGWKHRTPLGEESLIGLPGKIKVQDLEEVNPQYISGLSDKQVRVLYKRLHWLYHNILKKITEPLYNAHIFVLRALKERNIRFKLIGDRLDKETKRIVFEYPKPVGLKSFTGIPPEISKDELSKEVALEKVLELFPDFIILEEDPVHVYLVGGIVNRGRALPTHDIDLLFKQYFPDARIIHQFIDEISIRDKDIGRRLHFVWDPYGPTIGMSVPLYRLAFKKVTPGEMRRKSPYEYLGQRIQVMKPYRMLKPKSGFHKAEFWDVQEAWDKWAAKVIDKGLIVQKKYDGMRFQVHLKGNKIKIITEDKKRDRAGMFPRCTKELLAKKKADSFILDAEMVEYNCHGKEVKDKELLCEPFLREKMIPWVTVTKKKLDDNNIVFHIHDCVFFNGEDIHEKGYEERWNIIKKCFPPGLRHWRRVEGSEAKTVKEFFRAVRKERTRPGSEGAVVKIKDSIYKLTGRTSEWMKIKNLKEIDVMVWDIMQKKTREGKKLEQWVYFPVFLVPCGMKKQIKENQFIEWKGSCYARIGRAYGTKVKCQRGDIITVRPVQIVENKDPKTGKLSWSWMFPFFDRKRTDKNKPDTLTTVRRIVKVGTAPLSEELEKDLIIRLPKCPYWDDPSLCSLRDRFYVPSEKESLSILKEYLKFPILCKFANRFKCHWVKDYYYSLQPIEYDLQNVEEMDEDEEA